MKKGKVYDIILCNGRFCLILKRSKESFYGKKNFSSNSCNSGNSHFSACKNHAGEGAAANESDSTAFADGRTLMVAEPIGTAARTKLAEFNKDYAGIEE